MWPFRVFSTLVKIYIEERLQLIHLNLEIFQSILEGEGTYLKCICSQNTEHIVCQLSFFFTKSEFV